MRQMVVIQAPLKMSVLFLFYVLKQGWGTMIFFVFVFQFVNFTYKRKGS